MSRKYTSSAKYDWQQSIKPKIAPLTAAVTGALAASSLQAATITVTTLTDGLIAGECSLRSALYAASNNSTFNDCPAGDAGEDSIVFAPGLNGTIQLLAGQAPGYGADDSTLPIGDSVTIDGDSRITVRGTGAGGVFYAKYDGDAGLNAEDVTISNITISNGGGEARGGGIYARSTYLRIYDTTISDNSASLSGGGIHHQPYVGGYNKGLIIADSTITDNFTITPGVGGGGGGVYANLGNGGTVGVLNSNFTGNFSTGGNGGGLHTVISDYAYLTVKYNEFNGNDAKYSTGSGGGIFAELGYATALIDGNTFSDNQAQADGGGLFLREDASAFQQADITVDGNNFATNQAGSNGGGASITVLYGSNGTIANPVKTVDIGAGNTFNANASDNFGGGLDLTVGESVVTTIIGTEFNSNTASSSGGGLLLNATLTEASIGSTNFYYNTASDGQGGGARFNGDQATIYASDLRLISNEAPSGAGGGMQVSASQSTFGIENSEFYSNVAGSGCGGGLRVSSDAEQVGIAYSIFNSNSASVCGGGMSLFTPTLENSIVEVKYNEISYNNADGATLGGGGVFAEFGSGTTMFLKNSTISGNSATQADGGGVLFQGAMIAELKYATVANNFSYDEGAGLFNAASTCNVSNSILAGNENNTGILQDLRGSVYCDVSNSLLAGAKYSEYTDGGGNILNTDPLLGPLAGNGGWGGWTHALQPGSPAIDAGSAGAYAPDYDQRGVGFPRVSGPALDMGAYELFIDTIFSDRFEQP